MKTKEIKTKKIKQGIKTKRNLNKKNLKSNLNKKNHNKFKQEIKTRKNSK